MDCSTPRRIAARFFSALKCGKVKKKEEADYVAPPTHVIDRSDFLSEGCRNFNVVIGCFLLQLVAESKTEISKMTELRIQMESVLKNVKDELQNKDVFIAAKELESNDGVEESLDSEFNSDPMRSNIFDQPLKCDHVPNEDNSLEAQRMDRLEAELEAELEFLQLHLVSGKLSPETIEESSVSNGSTRSCSMSNGEVIDPTIYGEEEEEYPGLQSGVPPYELEKRLHELLETRQEQQIRELEIALASAKQELREKEREISWWKDTAQLMSRHVQEPSRFTHQLR